MTLGGKNFKRRNDGFNKYPRSDSGPARLVLLNNDATPLSYVVAMLQRCFGYSHAQADLVAARAQHDGACGLGSFSPEQARLKLSCANTNHIASEPLVSYQEHEATAAPSALELAIAESQAATSEAFRRWEDEEGDASLSKSWRRARKIARESGLPLVDLSKIELACEVLKLTPTVQSIARKAIPIALLGDLYVAFSSVPVPNIVRAISEATGFTIAVVIADEVELARFAPQQVGM